MEACITRSVRYARLIAAAAVVLLLFVGLGCKKVMQPPVRPAQEKVNFAASVAQINPFAALKILVGDTTLKKERASLLVRLYLDQREYPKATALIESLKLAVSPDSLAALYALSGDYERAARLTKDHLIKGIFFVRAESYDSAINSLGAGKHQLENHRLFYLGKALYNKNRLREAEYHLLLAKTIPPYLEQGHYELLARCLVQSGQAARAGEVVAQIKDDALRTYLEAKLAELGGDAVAAEKLYWQAIERFPGSGSAFSALGFVKPKLPGQFKALADVYYQRGNHKKALSYLNRAGKTAGTSYLRGMIYYGMNMFDSAAFYLHRSKSPKAYYWLGRIFETLNQDDQAIAAYDTSLARTTEGSLRRRVLLRKGHLLEEHASYAQACSTFLAIALQYPSERRRNLFRSGLLCYRSGQVTKAKEFFAQDTAAEFIYWHMRMNDRLGLKNDSLKNELLARYPLSYYTMIKEKTTKFYDTIPINHWLAKIGDTVPNFTPAESVVLNRAVFFLAHGERETGLRELRMIKTPNPANLLYLARMAQDYGLDHEAIRLGFALRKLAERAGVVKVTRELLPILYPIKYAASITQSGLEPALVLSVIRQESHFNPLALSPADARGLMQIIPRTGRLLARDLKMETYDLFDPECSIKFGMKYLGDQLQAFDCLPLALAAYNGGPVNVTKWLNRDPARELDEFIELIPFDETREYVKNVMLQKEIYAQLLNLGNPP